MFIILLFRRQSENELRLVLSHWLKILLRERETLRIVILKLKISSLLTYIITWWYLFAAGDTISFLVPDGDGREPLDFFGKTVPLLTVVFKGSVWTSGLAVKWKQINKQIHAEIYKFRSVHNTWSKT